MGIKKILEEKLNILKTHAFISKYKLEKCETPGCITLDYHFLGEHYKVGINIELGQNEKSISNQLANIIETNVFYLLTGGNE